jgi:hypothetical protein
LCATLRYNAVLNSWKWCFTHSTCVHRTVPACVFRGPTLNELSSLFDENLVRTALSRTFGYTNRTSENQQRDHAPDSEPKNPHPGTEGLSVKIAEKGLKSAPFCYKGTFLSSTAPFQVKIAQFIELRLINGRMFPKTYMFFVDVAFNGIFENPCDV